MTKLYESESFGKGVSMMHLGNLFIYSPIYLFIYSFEIYIFIPDTYIKISIKKEKEKKKKQTNIVTCVHGASI